MEKHICPLPVTGGMILVLALAACGQAKIATVPSITVAGTGAAGTAVACVLDAELQEKSFVPVEDRFGQLTDARARVRLKNSGTCPWPDGVRFVYYQGDLMGSNRSVEVRALPVGESADITFILSIPGYDTYRTTWRLIAPDGSPIGEPVPLEVAVGMPTAAPRRAADNPPADVPAATLVWRGYRQGDEGPVVTAIQYLLRSEGYTLEADGNFGPITVTAVGRFQAALGLPPDGSVDVQTWSALVARHELQKGDRGDDVKALQYLLSHVQRYDLLVDGDFGADTRAAVIDFQSDHVLWFIDGIVGESTWGALLPDD